MRREAILPLAAAMCCLLCGCGGDPGDVFDPWPRFERRVLRLYERVQPLRASRLGMTGADSLLFAFGDGEIDAALAALDSLLDVVDTLSQSIADPSRRLDIAAAAVWARGQRFSLDELGADRRGPVLWCRLAAEALETIPTRASPPTAGEAAAYAARIARLPLLLENAASRIELPPPSHVDFALTCLDELIARLGDLAARCEERWGGEAPDLSAAGEALLRFRGFVDGPLRDRARGSLIIGAEDLARVLRYDEELRIDPVAAAADLEKTLRRINSRYLAVRRSGPPAAAGTTDIAALLAEIDDGRDTPRLETARVAVPDAGAADPYLAPPAAPPFPSSWTIPCLGDGGGPVAWIDPSATGDPGILRLALMRVSSGARAYDERLCRTGSPLRVLFASRISRMAWVDLVVERLVDEAADDGLRRVHLEQRIRRTATAIATMRLHGGAYTSEMAASYIRSNVPGMNGEEAAAIVTAASIDPSTAYPGIAILLGEELLRKASFEQGRGTPGDKAGAILLDRAGRSLPSIIDGLGDDRR